MAKFLNNKLIISLLTSLMLLSTVSCKSLAMDENPKNKIETPKESRELTEEDLEGIMKNVDFFSDAVKSTGLKGADVDEFYDDQENKQIHQKK